MKSLAASLLCRAALVAATASLATAQLIPGRPGELVLPRRAEQPQQPREAVRPQSELQRFRRDLTEMQGVAPKVEAKLLEMGLAYPDLESLIVEVARSAGVNEMTNLMVVARRFGTAKVADELLFQVLARSLGDATRSTVETLATLKGADGKAALAACIRGRQAAPRKHATDLYVTMVDDTDLPFALELAGDQKLDLQLRGVDLLGAIGSPPAQQRLLALLSKDPALAAYACATLIRLGERAAASLAAVCNEPPIDRSWAYAAFALAEIAQNHAAVALDAAWVPQLVRQLRDPEVLTQSLVAVPLADLAYRAPSGVTFPDRAIAEALLDIVEPRRFVPNLDMLRKPSEQRLLRLTGRVVAASERLSWRDWWQTQPTEFVGMRASVAVAPDAVGRAVLTLRRDQRAVRLIGEDLADLPPLADHVEVLLTKAQMQDLAEALRGLGYGDPARMRDPSGLPSSRSLQLQVDGARAQVAVSALEHPAFDALAQHVEQVVDGELWQLFRHPTNEPDRAAFWRAERRWRDANQDELAREQRFAKRLIANWDALAPGLRGRGIARVFAQPQRRQLVDEADGDRILALLRDSDPFGELELRLLELAAGVPGDRIWRDCVDLAARRPQTPQAVRSVFAVLGPDAVLAALADARPEVRRVAIDEATASRDQRAAARIVELTADRDLAVQVKAAQAVGILQIQVAADRLIELIVAEATAPLVRREALRALGRVGGPKAFAVLERALVAPQQEDKEAALRGLGELKDPRAAHLLADLAVAMHGKDLGTLAKFYLQRLGGQLAVPALRHQVSLLKDPKVRAELVLLLGNYQDPQSVPDLLDLLRDPANAAEAATALSATTGVDVVGVEDRVAAAEAWWRQQKAAPQWRWLLDGLAAAGEASTLREEQFAVGVTPDAIVELARLLVEARTPRLAVLAGAVLRSTTGEDFGVVTPGSSREAREAIAARYRVLAETARAAQGR